MFIVIEGIDGAGKGYQRNRLVTELTAQGYSVSTSDFPDHQSVLYHHLIHPAIHEEIVLNDQAWFLSYVLDQIMWKEKIDPAVNNNEHHFIADGYFTTTLAYQVKLNNNIELNIALDFAEKFKLSVPDLAIYLAVDPAVAIERKMEEEGHDEGLDIFERDTSKQRKLHEAFTQLAQDNIFCPWVVVDGNGTMEQVAEKVYNQLNLHNLIKK